MDPKYKDPRWLAFREEVFKYKKYLQSFRCKNYCKNKKVLQVHHPFYINGLEIWQYNVEDMELLCRSCHKELHEKSIFVKDKDDKNNKTNQIVIYNSFERYVQHKVYSHIVDSLYFGFDNIRDRCNGILKNYTNYPCMSNCSIELKHIASDNKSYLNSDAIMKKGKIIKKCEITLEWDFK